MAGSKANLIFRVDGGRSVGMGHVMRCLSLANVLRETHGCDISFCMNQDEVGISRVERRGWHVQHVASTETRVQVPGSSLDDLHADGLIVDLPNGVSEEFVRGLRQSNPDAVILLMDGTCPGRLEADMIVAPIERLPEASAWIGFDGDRYEGPPYAILDLAYKDIPRRGARITRLLPRVLVTMGASDPCALTLQALRALDSMPESFEILIAVGPAFLHEDELAAWASTARHPYEVKREDSLLQLMMNSDVAVVSFGTTVYELAATGLPAVALSISDDHRVSAEVFARFGSMLSLGLFNSVDDGMIQNAVRRILFEPALWSEMAQRGQATVDGRGAERVAELLLSKMHNQRVSRGEVEVGKSPRT